MSQYTAHTPAIHCDGCANSIQRVLGRVPGVQKVAVDVDNKNVRVEYDPAQVNETALSERLTQAGFPPEQG